MDQVELGEVFPVQRERVALNELERVVRLRIDVHTYDIEARSGVAHRGAPGVAEQVQDSRFRLHAVHSAACRQQLSTPDNPCTVIRMDTDKMITRTEAASRLGVSMRTLDRYLKSGRIASAKYTRHETHAGPVRVSEASLTAFLDASKVTPDCGVVDDMELPTGS